MEFACAAVPRSIHVLSRTTSPRSIDPSKPDGRQPSIPHTAPPEKSKTDDHEHGPDEPQCKTDRRAFDDRFVHAIDRGNHQSNGILLRRYVHIGKNLAALQRDLLDRRTALLRFTDVVGQLCVAQDEPVAFERFQCESARFEETEIIAEILFGRLLEKIGVHERMSRQSLALSQKRMLQAFERLVNVSVIIVVIHVVVVASECRYGRS